MAGYIEGQIVRFVTEPPFTDEISGEPVDPTEVVFVYQPAGAGSPTSVKFTGAGYALGVVMKVGVGNYYIDIDTTGLPGAWQYEWASQGNAQTVSPGQKITVSPWALEPSF